jgi:hypothetical protein
MKFQQALSEKREKMQFLVSELARDEEPALEQGAKYPIWSPLNSHAAAHQLAQLLESNTIDNSSSLKIFLDKGMRGTD